MDNVSHHGNCSYSTNLPPQLSDMLFDSYAMRTLVLQQPSAPPCLLSSLMAAPDRSLHRFLVQTGPEQCILTVTMQLSEGLVSQ